MSPTARPRSIYTQLILTLLDELKITGADPAKVEELMRDKYGTLDNISRAEFKREVRKVAPYALGV
jgi:hypothetical protein